MGKHSLNRIKPRFSDRSRKAGYHRFKHTADRIAVLACGGDPLFNLFPCRVIKNGKRKRRKLFKILFAIFKMSVAHFTAGKDMRADFYSAPFKNLQGNSSGRSQRRRNTPRKMTAAPVVVIAVILQKRCVIRMGRTGNRLHF